jgi:hypothetical protein
MAGKKLRLPKGDTLMVDVRKVYREGGINSGWTEVIIVEAHDTLRGYFYRAHINPASLKLDRRRGVIPLTAGCREWGSFSQARRHYSKKWLKDRLWGNVSNNIFAAGETRRQNKYIETSRNRALKRLAFMEQVCADIASGKRKVKGA